MLVREFLLGGRTKGNHYVRGKKGFSLFLSDGEEEDDDLQNTKRDNISSDL